MASSYQRRLRNIQFYKERGQDLEKIIDALCRQLCDNGIAPKLPMLGIVDGDRQLNDITAGEFCMRLTMKHQPRRAK